MKRVTATIVALASSLALLPACSSWDTGTPPNDGPEKACLAAIETFARAAERCGEDYHTAYDSLLSHDANGDCKNVREIRDEDALRTTCLPFVSTEPCEDFLNGVSDPTCAKQLQRTN